jgi:mannose-6-phosphate isomerase-like protein (cupin superfamily)
MIISRFDNCKEIVAGDGVILRELLSPAATRELEMRYSLAHAKLAPGLTSFLHIMKTSEVYYILAGAGLVRIDDEEAEVYPGDSVYIPPGAKQQITSIGEEELVFLAIVDPAWRPEDEVIL